MRHLTYGLSILLAGLLSAQSLAPHPASASPSSYWPLFSQKAKCKQASYRARHKQLCAKKKGPTILRNLRGKQSLYIATDRQGNVYAGLVDPGLLSSSNISPDSFTLEKLSPSGKVLQKWSGFSPGTPPNIGPFGIAVDQQGDVYVADAGSSSVVKLSPDFKVLAHWGSAGRSPDQFEVPEGIAVDSKGYVYVADFLNSRIHKFSPDGKVLAVWGQPCGEVVGDPECGAAPGQINHPTGLAVDPKDNVYVSDHRNNRVEEFNSAGEFVRVVATGLDKPEGVSVDESENVYVSDAGNRRLVKFAASGKLVGAWTPPYSFMFGVAAARGAKVYLTSGDQSGGGILTYSAKGRLLSIWE